MKPIPTFLLSLVVLVNTARPAIAQPPAISKLLQMVDAECSNLEFEKAIKLYDRIIQMAPREPRYYVRRGLLYNQLCMFDESLCDFSKSIQLKPTAEAYRVRAETYWKLRKTKECLADYAEAIKLAPNDMKALKQRSHILRIEGRYKEAIVDAEKAIKLGAKGPHQIYPDIAESYMKLGQYEKAVETYTRLIEIAPDLSTGYYGRAAAYEKLGKSALAKKDKQKGVEADGMLDPNAVSGELRR